MKTNASFFQTFVAPHTVGFSKIFTLTKDHKALIFRILIPYKLLFLHFHLLKNFGNLNHLLFQLQIDQVFLINFENYLRFNHLKFHIDFNSTFKNLY